MTFKGFDLFSNNHFIVEMESRELAMLCQVVKIAVRNMGSTEKAKYAFSVNQLLKLYKDVENAKRG